MTMTQGRPEPAQTGATTRPRVLIEDWLPAAAIGVECMRERGTGQQPPHARLHVWFARRPLTVSRAAVLASLLPADFPRPIFERLLGFARPGDELVRVRQMMDAGIRVPGGFNGDRAFKGIVREDDLQRAHTAAATVWGSGITVIDPMAGGGSIPLEAARVGFTALANEYNPVACTILEATVDYPFRFGADLGARARHWAKVWGQRVQARIGEFYPEHRLAKVHAYIFARTIPCPDTQFDTPLVPDWHLLNPSSGRRLVAEPVVDKQLGTWHVRMREIGRGAGQLREPPRPTYGRGKGISLFTGGLIDNDYIKARASAGDMKSVLYAVARKTPTGLEFVPPTTADLAGIAAAERMLGEFRPAWERGNVIPTERIPAGDQPGGRLAIGAIDHWAQLFTPRQLLCFGVLTEELRTLRAEIVKEEGEEVGGAIVHLLAFVLDKFGNHNAILSSWDPTSNGIRSVFDRHGYSFKPAFAEMAPCGAGTGLDWATDNVIDAYEQISRLSRAPMARPATVSQGSATSLPDLEDRSVTAVVVDPPYDDNVQYSELADFFFVWLKRSLGFRRPEWFSTYLCEKDQEAVVNITRNLEPGGVRAKGKRDGSTATAAEKARAFYRRLMTETFQEAHRILRDDGVLTVMFTHKKQEAWAALFASLIKAGFTITATWPVKTETEHSTHQARKNAAQSTVILVARKRLSNAGVGRWDQEMRAEIRRRARETAERLGSEGLNAVDQLVGSFGPAMEVYSRHAEVRTDTGQDVGVELAIDEAADAVSAWRAEMVARHGLDGVEAEGRFALLCWDVLGAAEFRFNEAKLLGHAVGMDVDQLVAAGLVKTSAENVTMLSAMDRRRERAIEADEVTAGLFGPVVTPPKRGRGTRQQALKVHPNDPHFRTALDACHALALRYLEAASPAAGIGSARALVRQQRWTPESGAAKLMEALVAAAPEALRHEKRSPMSAKYPEFRAWHALLKPIFEIEPPDWTPKLPLQPALLTVPGEEDDEGDDLVDDDGEE